jgi:hypothetical protein
VEDKPFGELLDEAYVKQLLETCDRERTEGKHPKDVQEGDRLASEFRKMFPEVADKDIGTLLVVISRVLNALADSKVAMLSTNLELCIGSYSHAAAVILKSVDEMRGL